MPAGLMFGAGFFCGIVVAVLVISALDKNGDQVAATQTPSAASKPATKPAKPADKTTTRFDFFTVLPEQEVIVPDESPEIKPRTSTTSSPAADNIISGEKYLLQAGSFRNFNDADRRRAQMILLGLDARVESVDANGDRWHRVYVGPFQSRSKLASARDTLNGEGIDTLVIRQKQ
ncbi:SPOR domain-containing protein [Spongiibacter sp. KMU-158]|uniref:SPOR domain-containing protein n=2 Tax=Spongiibacter pelagi TaxID=2760804 RepID=A0A927GUE0_9GAMM|nr:SPOR domain-containing protein [Spongiibacter pelagi]